LGADGGAFDQEYQYPLGGSFNTVNRFSVFEENGAAPDLVLERLQYYLDDVKGLNDPRAQKELTNMLHTLSQATKLRMNHRRSERIASKSDLTFDDANLEDFERYSSESMENAGSE